MPLGGFMSSLVSLTPTCAGLATGVRQVGERPFVLVFAANPRSCIA